jgi:RHS repeat-associated protein
MHARYSNNAWGRFLSVDPTWESADLGKPQTWNRYAYVTNNPIDRIDPDGKSEIELLLNRLKHITDRHMK